MQKSKKNSKIVLFSMTILLTITYCYVSSIERVPIFFNMIDSTKSILLNFAHIPAYLVLTVLWLCSYRAKNEAMGAGTELVILVGLLILAIADELHQTLVPNRTGSALDVGLDVIGIFLGAAIYHSRVYLIAKR